MEKSNNTHTGDIQSKPEYFLQGLALSAMISGYILGPLLIIGGGALWLQKNDYIGRIMLIIAVLIAFVFSNALIIWRSKKMILKFNKKTGIKDPTAEQVAQWRKNKPASYKYDDDEEEEN